MTSFLLALTLSFLPFLLSSLLPFSQNVACLFHPSSFPPSSPPAAMVLLCAVKVPDAVTEMMMAEFQHAEACQRINSILKFNTLWRFRYQVWPRMEEGAQQIFKVQKIGVTVSKSYTILIYLLLYISFSNRSLHPASTSLCHLLYWACPVSPYLTPPGCPRIQATSRTPSMKTSP